MRILAIADRRPQTPIKEILIREKIDLICTLGDLTFFDISELKQISNIPKIGVYGNHCSGKYFESLSIQNLHLKTFKHQGYTFGGFQGSLRYKPGEYFMYTQKEALSLLNNFPYVDVMIAHSPPYGINDEPGDPVHAGLIALTTYIESKMPKYFLHGHTYPANINQTLQAGNTKIIYIFKERIITI
ncbi:MAG: metallophosphoesterase [Patescibacteria group bacterium]